MKKILTVIIAGLLLQFQSYGHAWVQVRHWPFLFFNWSMYQASAQVSSLSYYRSTTGYDWNGSYIGWNPKAVWGAVCNQNDIGPSLPRHAACNSSGMVNDVVFNGYTFYATPYYYDGHATADIIPLSWPWPWFWPWGYYITHVSYSAHGRAQAGFTGEYMLNPEQAEQLTENGSSSGDIQGNFGVSDDGLLAVSDMSGFLMPEPGSNFNARLQLLVLKERDDVDEDEATRIADLKEQGVFENIVYTSEIVASGNGGVQTSGIFQQMGDEIWDGSSVQLNGVNLTTQLNIPLGPHEHLTLVTLIDGGFDISSAVVSQLTSAVKPGAQAAASDPGGVANTTQAREAFSFYPNPASGSISCKAFAGADDSRIIITACDLLGRIRSPLYSGKLTKGYNLINDIDVSGLPKGVQLLEVQIGNDIKTYKIVVR